MSTEEKQLLERVNNYCSYGVLLITICFCALIYWGNRQMNPEIDIDTKVNNREIIDQRDVVATQSVKVEWVKYQK